MLSFFKTSKTLEMELNCWAFFQEARKRLTTLCEELLRIHTSSQGDPSPKPIYKPHDHTPGCINLLSNKVGIMLSPLKVPMKRKWWECVSKTLSTAGPVSGQKIVVCLLLLQQVLWKEASVATSCSWWVKLTFHPGEINDVLPFRRCHLVTNPAKLAYSRVLLSHGSTQTFRSWKRI